MDSLNNNTTEDSIVAEDRKLESLMKRGQEKAKEVCMLLALNRVFLTNLCFSKPYIIHILNYKNSNSLTF